MFVKITKALKNVWTTVKQYSEAMDVSAHDDVRFHCRHLESRIAELERRLDCQTADIFHTTSYKER
jgi:hypothetical protein